MSGEGEGAQTRKMDHAELLECLGLLVDAATDHSVTEVFAEFGEVWGRLFHEGEVLKLKPHHVRLQVEMAEAQETGMLGEDELTVTVRSSDECRLHFDRDGRIELRGGGPIYDAICAACADKGWL